MTPDIAFSRILTRTLSNSLPNRQSNIGRNHASECHYRVRYGRYETPVIKFFKPAPSMAAKRKIPIVKEISRPLDLNISRLSPT